MKQVFVVLGRNNRIDDSEREETLEKIIKDRGNITQAIRHLLDLYKRLQEAAKK